MRHLAPRAEGPGTPARRRPRGSAVRAARPDPRRPLRTPALADGHVGHPTTCSPMVRAQRRTSFWRVGREEGRRRVAPGETAGDEGAMADSLSVTASATGNHVSVAPSPSAARRGSPRGWSNGEASASRSSRCARLRAPRAGAVPLRGGRPPGAGARAPAAKPGRRRQGLRVSGVGKSRRKRCRSWMPATA